MSNGTPQKRTRQQRVATVELPPGTWGRLLAQLRRGSVLLRLALCTLAALVLWSFTKSWDPPFTHSLGDIPKRNIIARVDFVQPDEAATEKLRQKERELALAVYDQDPQPLIQLRAQLRNEITKLLAAGSLEEVDAQLWSEFQPELAPGTPDPTEEQRKEQFQRFRDAFVEENAVEQFGERMAEVMAPLEQWGLLETLPEEHEEVNSESIYVRRLEGENFSAEAKTSITEVLIENASARLQQSLIEKLSSAELAQRVYAWLKPRLMTSLTLNLPATREAQQLAADAVDQQYKEFRAGQDQLAAAGQPLSAESLDLLTREHQQLVVERDLGNRIRRSLAVWGMFIALYTLCGFYIYVREPAVISDLVRFVCLLSLVVVTVMLAYIVNQYLWDTVTVIPLLLFAMTVVIAYQQEMALLLSASVTLLIVMVLGLEQYQALVFMATIAGAILVLKQVRTRGKLLSVGLVAATVALLTTLGVGTLEGDSWGPLIQTGLTLALWSIIAGSLMTVLLPAVEKVFGVQTDLSLIELGDPAHPLLQELIRRAPGTYNHSITVASLAEAAAESIGARGLLVRVGAYFHDIGKMLKPGYFIENQSRGDNRHDSLVPAMSTLVIIAHVKDGADLARQNKLPEPIIDFIQQHHGTTLVEYFYRQANEKKKGEDPEGGDVDESSFRYPGPKPQSKEAGVLMLSDAVESATRALKEPTPSRIENIVEDLSMKRLLDGQFDECGLTLQELQRVGESLVKSLTAVYHGRVKYPGQETA